MQIISVLCYDRGWKAADSYFLFCFLGIPFWWRALPSRPGGFQSHGSGKKLFSLIILIKFQLTKKDLSGTFLYVVYLFIFLTKLFELKIIWPFNNSKPKDSSATVRYRYILGMQEEAILCCGSGMFIPDRKIFLYRKYWSGLFTPDPDSKHCLPAVILMEKRTNVDILLWNFSLFMCLP